MEVLVLIALNTMIIAVLIVVPVTTQHTPRTSWNVLLVVVLLLPTITTTITTKNTTPTTTTTI